MRSCDNDSVMSDDKCCSFIFTLQEFAKELTSLIDAMGRVYAIELAGASFRGNMKRRLTSMCGCFGRRKKRGLAMSGAGIDEERPGIRRRLCK